MKQRTPQLRHGLILLGGGWPQTLDQQQSLNTLGRGGGKNARDTRAHRMSEQAEFLPAQFVDDFEHIADMIDMVIPVAGRAMIRAPVAGKIQRNDIILGQQRREAGETRRVIEPAMQGQHRRICRITPGLGREATECNIDGEFGHAFFSSSRKRAAACSRLVASSWADQSAANSGQPWVWRNTSSAIASTCGAVAFSAGIYS